MSQPATEPSSPEPASPLPTFQPPSSTPPTGTRAPIFGVRQTPSTSTASEPAPSPAGANAGDPLDDAGPAPTSTRSVSDAKPLKVGSEVSEAVRGVVLAAGVMLHGTLARTEPEQGMGLWLMDEDQAAEIADPLASIAKRRAGGALVSNDLGDLIRAGLAAAGYVLVNGIKAFQVRRALRRMSTVPGFAEATTTEGSPTE